MNTTVRDWTKIVRQIEDKAFAEELRREQEAHRAREQRRSLRRLRAHRAA